MRAADLSRERPKPTDARVLEQRQYSRCRYQRRALHRCRLLVRVLIDLVEADAAAAMYLLFVGVLVRKSNIDKLVRLFFVILQGTARGFVTELEGVLHCALIQIPLAFDR